MDSQLMYLFTQPHNTTRRSITPGCLLLTILDSRRNNERKRGRASHSRSSRYQLTISRETIFISHIIPSRSPLLSSFPPSPQCYCTKRQRKFLGNIGPKVSSSEGKIMRAGPQKPAVGVIRRRRGSFRHREGDAWVLNAEV